MFFDKNRDRKPAPSYFFRTTHTPDEIVDAVHAAAADEDHRVVSEPPGRFVVQVEEGACTFELAEDDRCTRVAMRAPDDMPRPAANRCFAIVKGALFIGDVDDPDSLGMGIRRPSEEYTLRYRSPDGHIELFFAYYEMRMGHWVHPPCITDRRTGKRVFEIDQGTLWDGIDFWFLTSGHLQMNFRRYPGRGRSVQARFDPSDWSVEHNLVGREGGAERTREPAAALAAKLNAIQGS